MSYELNVYHRTRSLLYQCRAVEPKSLPFGACDACFDSFDLIVDIQFCVYIIRTYHTVRTTTRIVLKVLSTYSSWNAIRRTTHMPPSTRNANTQEFIKDMKLTCFRKYGYLKWGCVARPEDKVKKGPFLEELSAFSSTASPL
jgi:hypothetical protein